MRKCIVSQMVAKAAMQLGIPSIPEFDDEQQEAIQEFFDKNPNAFNNGPLLAEFTEAITGYKPMIKVAGCRMWAVWRFKNAPTKLYLTISTTTGGRAYGVQDAKDPNSAACYFDSNCEIVTSAEATNFINNVVASWTDDQVMTWMSSKLGGPYVSEFMRALDDEHHC